MSKHVSPDAQVPDGQTIQEDRQTNETVDANIVRPLLERFQEQF